MGEELLLKARKHQGGKEDRIDRCLDSADQSAIKKFRASVSNLPGRSTIKVLGNSASVVFTVKTFADAYESYEKGKSTQAYNQALEGLVSTLLFSAGIAGAVTATPALLVGFGVSAVSMTNDYIINWSEERYAEVIGSIDNVVSNSNLITLQVNALPKISELRMSPTPAYIEGLLNDSYTENLNAFKQKLVNEKDKVRR